MPLDLAYARAEEGCASARARVRLVRAAVYDRSLPGASEGALPEQSLDPIASHGPQGYGQRQAKQDDQGSQSRVGGLGDSFCQPVVEASQYGREGQLYSHHPDAMEGDQEGFKVVFCVSVASHDVGTAYDLRRMMGDSHRTVGASTGALLGAAAGLPWWQVASLTIVSCQAAKGPDQAELGGLLAHRRWTHSPVGIAIAGLGVMFVVSIVVSIVAAKVPEVGARMPEVLAAGRMIVQFAWPFVGAAVCGLAVGYVSHLLADACTKDGIRVAYPLSGRQVWLLPRRWRLRTGSPAEYRAVLVLSALTLLMLALSW